MNKNSWREKIEERFEVAHRRRPGRGKFFKHLGNRASRRRSNRMTNWQSKGYAPPMRIMAQ